MSIIEEKIRKNKEIFDSYEPNDGHFDRFQKKLSKLHPQKKTNIFVRTNVLLKVAAVFIILVTVTFIIINYTNDNKQLIVTSNQEDIVLPDELKEVKQYYTYLNQQKIEEIENLDVSDEEAEKLKQMAFNEMTELDADNKELEKEYIESNNNERLFSSIVTNYRLLTSVLDRIIDNINQIQNQKTSELNLPKS
ncbi:MAG: hypothetical protein KAT33_08720 [Bacteroidales bacterium]|nr:hypothetical protein [Bacteroidales bacterium]MCK4639490.1 hypothetical protein [Bacteroidales bacterium]